MGTRSFVGTMIGDECRAVYVHWDGYLSGVGSELQEYRTANEVIKLISHGDRSSLEEGYYKDRGEENVAPKNYKTFAEFFDTVDGVWAEWYYIFKDGVWYCGNIYESSKLYKTLTPYKEAVEFWAIESAKAD